MFTTRTPVIGQTFLRYDSLAIS